MSDQKCKKCRRRPAILDGWCEICEESHDKWCEHCHISYRIMFNIIDAYTNPDENGYWKMKLEADESIENISLFIKELDWLFDRYIALWGYQNSALELSQYFLTNPSDEYAILDDLEEIHRTNLRTDELISVFRDGQLIIPRGDQLYIGPINMALRDLRLLDYNIRSNEFNIKSREYLGILNVALTKGLFINFSIDEDGRRIQRFPKFALGIFHLLSQVLMDAGDQQISDAMSIDQVWNTTKTMLDKRQRKYLLQVFISLRKGSARFIDNFDDTNIYWYSQLTKFLERFRERERDRYRGRGR